MELNATTESDSTYTKSEDDSYGSLMEYFIIHLPHPTQVHSTPCVLLTDVC